MQTNKMDRVTINLLGSVFSSRSPRKAAHPPENVLQMEVRHGHLELHHLLAFFSSRNIYHLHFIDGMYIISRLNGLLNLVQSITITVLAYLYSSFDPKEDMCIG
jgi:hypothetical protein